MKIATWNINGLRARLDFILHWLAARQPDVVGLQELKLTDDEFPREELEAAGYHSVCYGQKSWNGVAVLSRHPVSEIRSGLPGEEALGSRLLTASTAGLTFTTVYCPNGKSLSHEDYPRKLAWFDSLASHFESEHDPAEPSVLCGDFNICPRAIDSWNEEALHGHLFHTEEERSRFQRLLGWGFGDLYRQQHPDTPMYSWWDYRAGAFHRTHGLRIDFVLGTRTVQERLQDAEIDRDYRKKKEGLTASDHAPVIAHLR